MVRVDFFVLAIGLLSTYVWSSTSASGVETTDTIDTFPDEVNSTAGAVENLVATTCHVISEKLVATATATVSSAFKDICTTEKLIGELKSVEARISLQLNALSSEVKALSKKVIGFDRNTTSP